MFLTKMIDFCKSLNCPSSQELLAYQAGDVSRSLFEEINRHTESCEFCEAEIEFYEHYPQSEETVQTEKIPSPLFELAEALLNNKHKDTSLLNKLLNENDGLMLREA
ncbi:MAG: hypothetical protein ACR2J3_05130 [Aridibacter sp.]